MLWLLPQCMRQSTAMRCRRRPAPRRRSWSLLQRICAAILLACATYGVVLASQRAVAAWQWLAGRASRGAGRDASAAHQSTNGGAQKRLRREPAESVVAKQCARGVAPERIRLTCCQGTYACAESGQHIDCGRYAALWHTVRRTMQAVCVEAYTRACRADQSCHPITPRLVCVCVCH